MKKDEETLRRESADEKPLGRRNFIAMALAGAMIVVGFLLMLGPANGAAGTFNPDIFSTRRIVVVPFNPHPFPTRRLVVVPPVAFLGFAGTAAAIICSFGARKPK